MPTYDFQCRDCQYRQEFWVAIQAVDLLEDAELPRCQNCGSKPMKRLLAAPVGIIFRGGGWASKS